MQIGLSGRTVALTGIVHDVDVGPQFRAGQVVAVLDRVVQGRQQDEEHHGVDELGEAPQLRQSLSKNNPFSTFKWASVLLDFLKKSL